MMKLKSIIIVSMTVLVSGFLRYPPMPKTVFKCQVIADIETQMINLEVAFNRMLFLSIVNHEKQGERHDRDDEQWI